jgi:thiol-disulfide isomerase/thioredoxin
MLSRAALVALSVAWLAAPAAAQEDPFDERRLAQLVELSQRALQELTDKQYDTSIASYHELLKLLDEGDWPEEIAGEQRQIAHYNLACAHSLKGDKPKALEHFRVSVDLGFEDLDHIAKDTDLDNIRHEPAFREVIAKLGGGGGAPDPFAAEKRKLLRQMDETDPNAWTLAFDLETIQDGRVKLADLKGKVVLVDVWGTWCPPCRREIPHLKDLYARYAEKGFVIVGLNSEKVPADQAKAHVQKFLAENGIEYPCALAPRTLIDSIPDFQGYPTLILVDREGKVRLRKVGYTEGAVLEAAIVKLLGAEAGAAPPKAPEAKEPAKKGELF